MVIPMHESVVAPCCICVFDVVKDSRIHNDTNFRISCVIEIQQLTLDSSYILGLNCRSGGSLSLSLDI